MGPRFNERGNRYRVYHPALSHIASMGPRFNERGNTEAAEAAVPLAVLQWGHASMSVEIRKKGQSPYRRGSFNGATLQ